jgi:putative membrane protein
MRALLPQTASHIQPWLAFVLGAGLIGMGAITAWYSAQQYAVVLRSLTPAEFPPGYTAKWGLWINRALAVFGLLLAGILALWHLH